MKKKLLAGLVIVLFLIGIGGTAQAISIYSTDFESGLDTEWTPRGLSISDNSTFTNFLGRFGNYTATLSLDGLGSGTRTVTLEFDFYAIDSWDGDSQAHGLDYFGIFGDYTNEWTVARSVSSATDTFPYTVTETGNFGYSNWSDDIYREISISFEHTGDSLSLSFYGRGLQGLNDESWGLDNVSVSTAGPVPEPATMLLFGAGIAGITGTRLRRGKK